MLWHAIRPKPAKMLRTVAMAWLSYSTNNNQATYKAFAQKNVKNKGNTKNNLKQKPTKTNLKTGKNLKHGKIP